MVMMLMLMRRVPAPPPEALRKERQEGGGVDGDHADARFAEAPAVDIDDRGRTRQGLHGADDGGGHHEEAREEEHRDAGLARPRDAEAPEHRGRDAQDGGVGEDVEDDDGPEVLGAEGAVRARERLDLPIVVVPLGRGGPESAC